MGALGSIRISMGIGLAISGKGDGYLLIAVSVPGSNLTTPGGFQAMGDLSGVASCSWIPPATCVR